MLLNWLGYDFDPCNGYGRYSTYLIKQLTEMGVCIRPITHYEVRQPRWLQYMAGIGYDRLTIACVPPYMLTNLPGEQWALTMTEGSRLPDGWAQRINETCQRVIVPCAWNKATFEDGGVTVPVHVIPGGTCPVDFAPRLRATDKETYTFLTIADRGARKGWGEVWQAFWQAFGDNPNVRLIIKSRPAGNDLVDRIAEAADLDGRITIWRDDIPDMADVYGRANCVVLPSRSEGWGMLMREAAMMGLPVITTRVGGLDDGHTDAWAIVVDGGRWEAIPPQEHIAGRWFRASVDDVARHMTWCYENPGLAAVHGRMAAKWLRKNQTWQQSAEKLMELICH
jgi:glycosyltransferase involved in cell wall biosynthesis